MRYLKKVPILDRIDAALASGPLDMHALALKVFPPADYPRAWRNATGGGPPGLSMALGSAVRRGRYETMIRGPGPGGHTVYPRKKK